MTHRIYLVGTDTAVGKTEVACTLLRQALARGIRALPFKPAQSGSDAPADVERLLEAADLPATDAAAACPFAFEPPLAPGLAEPAHRPAFLGGQPPRTDTLSIARAALDAWIARHQPELVLVEGAGGLHVPMPGGTWQPAWIETLADAVVIVARTGLGTINHTLLTIDAVRALGVPLLGFYANAVTAPDPSSPDNPTVITHARAIPCLGTLPHGAPAVGDLLSPLLSALTSPC